MAEMTWRRPWGAWMAALAAAILQTSPARAITVDDRGEMSLGMRAYTAMRFGTEEMGGEDDPLSFPRSAAGHMRQHRYFVELKFDHDLKRLAYASHGPLRVLGWLQPTTLRYSLQYRGEWEGLYEYGPEEFREPFSTTLRFKADVPRLQFGPLSFSPDIPPEIAHNRTDKLRRNARQRHRLFLAYLDFERGPFFARIGRQILAWGETDAFRLLDNINPLDSSFGGFLIALDERRVPLDMLRASWQFGSVGPLHDLYVEGFAASGNRIAVIPGIPPGSPWIPGGLGTPSTIVRTVADEPDATSIRGGARLVFNHSDVTYSLAHYWTYLDNPGVQFTVPGAPPGGGLATPRFGREIIADQTTPRVPITGASATFPLPSLYTIVRSELAYFHNEPTNRQGVGTEDDSLAAPGTPGYRRLVRADNLTGGVDPFVYPAFLDLTRTEPITARRLQLDSLNFALGFDVNRFVRWINPRQTIFVSTQVFYKHFFDSPGDLVLVSPVRNLPLSRAIPILGTPGCDGGRRGCRARPRFIRVEDDAILHTLLISTSYSGGRVVPGIALFYDWQGALVFQPAVTFIRDPFRLTVDYTRLDTGLGSGQLSALRDRDNVRAQIEFVF